MARHNKLASLTADLFRLGWAFGATLLRRAACELIALQVWPDRASVEGFLCEINCCPNVIFLRRQLQASSAQRHRRLVARVAQGRSGQKSTCANTIQATIGPQLCQRVHRHPKGFGSFVQLYSMFWPRNCLCPCRPKRITDSA